MMISRILEEQADKNQVAKANDGLRRQQREQKAVKGRDTTRPSQQYCGLASFARAGDLRGSHG
eukprot:1801957-Pleurochrysis_carterae.AAC.1